MAEELGCLSDGTPVKDVAADTPVEVRFSGGVTWFPGFVVRVEVDDPIDPEFLGRGILVEYTDDDGTFESWCPSNFVRKRKFA